MGVNNTPHTDLQPTGPTMCLRNLTEERGGVGYAFLHSRKSNQRVSCEVLQKIGTLCTKVSLYTHQQCYTSAICHTQEKYQKSAQQKKKVHSLQGPQFIAARVIHLHTPSTDWPHPSCLVCLKDKSGLFPKSCTKAGMKEKAKIK